MPKSTKSLVEVMGQATPPVMGSDFKKRRTIHHLSVCLHADLESLPQEERDRQLGAALRKLWERQDRKWMRPLRCPHCKAENVNAARIENTAFCHHCGASFSIQGR